VLLSTWSTDNEQVTSEPPKPKRSYTVTERVLTACRINVEKARKAALERRFCATRGTWPEMRASHAKLELAQRVKLEDNTYKYCSIFRHGLLVANLERSLVITGESREEYLAHLARFAAVPGVFDFEAASQEVKLAQACGFTTWRRLRALRLQSEWALRMMVHNLRAAIRTRHAGLDAQQPPLGHPPSLTPEGFVQLAIDLEHAGEDWPSLWRPMRKLNNRFDQLWCTLVQELGEPEPFLARLSFTERAAMRLSPIVANFQTYAAEVLGNPLIRPKRLLELLKSRPVYVKPVEEWACSQIPYEVEDRISAELRRGRIYLQSLENKQVTLMGNLDYHLLREARKPQDKSESQQDASLAVELPGNFEEFLALVQAAFGEGPETFVEGRSFSSAVQAATYPFTRPSDTLSPEDGREGRGAGEGAGPTAGIHGSSAAPETRKPAPPPTRHDLAQLLWDSATLPRRRAEEEARLLAEYLTEYAARLASSDPKDERRRQNLADRILKLFRQVDDQKRDSIGLNRQARLALHDIAVARYGKQPEFECLIAVNDRTEQIYSEFYKMYWAEVHRILGRGGGNQEARGKRQEAKAERNKARREKLGVGRQ
jgi:hypothetical protein